jgi:hypothetical protein
MLVSVSAFHTYTLIYLFQFVKDYEKEYLLSCAGVSLGFNSNQGVESQRKTPETPVLPYK